MDTFSPMGLAFYRNLIALCFLLVIALVKKVSLKLHKKDVFRMIVVGLLGITLYHTFENYGIILTSPSVASIIIGTIPVFSMILDGLLSRGKFSLMTALSCSLSFVGVFLIIDKSDLSSTSLGVLFMFFAVATWIGFNYTVKPLYGTYSKLTITFYQFLFGTLLLTPFGFQPIEGPIFTLQVMGNLLFLSGLCSALCFFLYIYALETLPITLTTLFVNCIPLVTFISSIFILKEGLSLPQLVGGFLIITAVCLPTLLPYGKKVSTTQNTQ